MRPDIEMATGGPFPVNSTSGEGATVLVVEDDVTVRSLMCDVLAMAGYLVLGAATGDEAVGLSARYEGPIALVIADLVMPGPSGQQLVQSLRTRRPDLRALYVSGYSDAQVQQEGLLRSSREFLGKPFTVDDLIAKVREILGA